MHILCISSYMQLATCIVFFNQVTLVMKHSFLLGYNFTITGRHYSRNVYICCSFKFCIALYMHLEMLNHNKMLYYIILRACSKMPNCWIEASTSICAIESLFKCVFTFRLKQQMQSSPYGIPVYTVLFSAPSPLVVPTQSSPREVTTALYISVGFSAVINNCLYFFCNFYDCLYEKFKVTKKKPMFNKII